MVYGIWYMVYGIWYMVYVYDGIWYMRYAVCAAWARAIRSMSMGHGVMLQHRDVLHTFYVIDASSVKQKVSRGKQVACSMYVAIVYSCACCRTFHLPSTEFVVRFFMAFCMSVSSLPGCIQCGSYHVSACRFSQSRFRSFVYEVFATTMC